MIKKLTGLFCLALLSSTIFAAEGGRRSVKRSASLSFAQQDLRAPLFRASEGQVSLQEIGCTNLDYNEKDLTPEEAELPSLTKSNPLRIFYKYSSKKDSESFDKCVKLFAEGKLGVNDCFLSHTGDQELPLHRVMENPKLIKALLKYGANPCEPFQFESNHSTGVDVSWISPLSMACLTTYENNAAKLYALKGCNFNFVDHDGLTPFHYLIVGSSLEDIAYILASGVITIAKVQESSDIERWIDSYCFMNNTQLHKDLITVVQKQQDGIFEEEDRKTYEGACELLEKQRSKFIQDTLEEEVGKRQNVALYLRNRARSIKSKGRR